PEQPDARCDLHNEPARREPDESKQTEIAVRQLAPVLPNVGRLHRLGGIERFGCLAPPDLGPVVPDLAHCPRPGLCEVLEVRSPPVSRIARGWVVVDAAKPRFLPVKLAARLATAVA